MYKILIKPEKPCPRPISPFILPKKPHNIFPKKLFTSILILLCTIRKALSINFLLSLKSFILAYFDPFWPKKPSFFLISLSHFKVRWYCNSMQKLGYLLQVILDKKWTKNGQTEKQAELIS